MNTIKRLVAGPDPLPLQQGRSPHGRWRCGHQPAGDVPDGSDRIPAVLIMVHDAERLAFALADGPAAALLADRLVDYLWTRETADDDWPQNLRTFLADTTHWADAPAGLVGFICGRLERNMAGGRIYLAWLGMPGIRLIDRFGYQITLDTVLEEGEGWTPENGPEPVGMALHAHRSALYDLVHLSVFTESAGPIGLELPDLSGADVQLALQDWSEDATRDLIIFDLQINPVETTPSSVLLAYRWISPSMCLFSWAPSPEANAYRLEEATNPEFTDASLIADLTDPRQLQYSLSPPASGPRYFRVTPLNQGTPGAPSEPVSVVPMTLASPVMEPIRWSEDGGHHLTWTPVAQATSYEVETSTSSNFLPGESHIIYRGELAETFLAPDTPPNLYYRVRAINVLYAPHTPSPWSQPRLAPSQLPTPAFTEVLQSHLAWTPITGAHLYAVRVTARGFDDDQGEDTFVAEPFCPTADQPATYHVRAFRFPNDERTASEWSQPVTLTPSTTGPARRLSPTRSAAPVLVASALVALLVGTALGLIGLQAYEDYVATSTRTPLPQEALMATTAAFEENVANATGVAQRGTAAAELDAENALLETTIDAQVDAATLRAKNDAAQTASAFAQTVTAVAWTDTPTATATPSATATPTATKTPNLTQTLQVAIGQAQTATADAWTATPTATPTTPTRTPSRTPDVPETVEAAVLETISSWTATPTATQTRRPSPTPDVSKTVAAALLATASGWTATPTPSNTPNWSATLDAAVLTNLPPGCYLIDPDSESLPVYTGPSPAYPQQTDSVPHLAAVRWRWEQKPSDVSLPTTVWLAVSYVEDGAPVHGWLAVPDGVDPTAWMGGPACRPDIDVPALDLTEPRQLTELTGQGVCVLTPLANQNITVRSQPRTLSEGLAPLSGPRIVLGRTPDENTGADWLLVWLEGLGLEGWVVASQVSQQPPGCAAGLGEVAAPD